MSEGGTTGGASGFTVGGSYTDSNGNDNPTGAVVGSQPHIDVPVDMKGKGKRTTDITATANQ